MSEPKLTPDTRPPTPVDDSLLELFQSEAGHASHVDIESMAHELARLRATRLSVEDVEALCHASATLRLSSASLDGRAIAVLDRLVGRSAT